MQPCFTLHAPIYLIIPSVSSHTINTQHAHYESRMKLLGRSSAQSPRRRTCCKTDQALCRCRCVLMAPCTNIQDTLRYAQERWIRLEPSLTTHARCHLRHCVCCRRSTYSQSPHESQVCLSQERFIAILTKSQDQHWPLATEMVLLNKGCHLAVATSIKAGVLDTASLFTWLATMTPRSYHLRDHLHCQHVLPWTFCASPSCIFIPVVRSSSLCQSRTCAPRRVFWNMLWLI